MFSVMKTEMIMLVLMKHGQQIGECLLLTDIALDLHEFHSRTKVRMLYLISLGTVVLLRTEL